MLNNTVWKILIGNVSVENIWKKNALINYRIVYSFNTANFRWKTGNGNDYAADTKCRIAAIIVPIESIL